MNHIATPQEKPDLSVEALHAKLDRLLVQQAKQQELIDEMMPIVHDMMGVATQKLQVLDEKGYFRFGAEVMGVLDKVVTGFAPDDVRALGDNVVTILETVRAATQPPVLAIAAETTDALNEADKATPTGFYGVVKAMREDDVRNGMGAILAMLRGLGRGIKQVRRGSVGTALQRHKHSPLAAMLAPKRRAARSQPAAVAPTPTPACQVVQGDILGHPVNAEGFLLDPTAWTREVGTAMAAAMGLGTLTEAHWALIQFARSDFETKEASPNVRRISVGAGVGTKDIYRLFPKAPGKTIAKIAGIPKPGGCL